MQLLLLWLPWCLNTSFFIIRLSRSWSGLAVVIVVGRLESIFNVGRSNIVSVRGLLIIWSFCRRIRYIRRFESTILNFRGLESTFVWLAIVRGSRRKARSILGLPFRQNKGVAGYIIHISTVVFLLLISWSSGG